MRPPIFILAAIALVTGLPQHATAASPVTGTIACTAQGKMPFGPPFLPEELAEPLTRPLRVKATTDFSTCDSSGVVGAQSPIASVDVRLGGKLGPETSCIDFLGTLSLTGKVQLRWRGFGPQHNRVTVGTSKATIASATYDSGTESVVVVTNPVSGAFAGSTVTMHFNLIDAAEYADHCTTHDYRFTAFLFDANNPITIDVP